MISHNPHSNCLNARLYYWDFLSEKAREGIPESALFHIKHCGQCETEIERLKLLLAHKEEGVTSEQSRQDSAISTLLKLHFSSIGEPVTCTTVRPFLASLADPLLQVRIPTPITMHVDKCMRCSHDVQALRDLQLTHKQLCHLGQLLADEPTGSAVNCSTARAAIPAVISMAFRETDAETLKHLCVCPSCRRQLYRRREASRQKLLQNETAQGTFPCEAVATADIYDYALPYGIDPATDQYAEFRPGLTSHLRTCPRCLSKIQELHRTINAIAERAESEVVTVYHLDDSVEAPVLSGLAENVAGLTAEVADHEKEQSEARSGPAIDVAVDLERKTSPPKVRFLFKAGLVAAAVVLIGLALLHTSSSATAVTLNQIYSAVERVRNVHITMLDDESQEQWVSQGLNTYLLRVGSQWMLSDISTGVRRSKDSITGTMDEKLLAEDEITSIKSRMNITLALLPFHDMSGIPRNAQWSHIAEGTLQSTGRSTEVYDLIWTESSYAQTVHKRWRFFVDPQTTRPLRVEIYQKRYTDKEYSPGSVKQVEYISDAEMEAVIKEVF